VFSYHDVSSTLDLPLHHPNPSLKIKGVSIDTRTLEEGNLFVAFKGECSDGHDFLREAFRKGASGALVQESSSEFPNLLSSENPEKILQKLAEMFRKKTQAKVIGITGSVGKTTTKEFLRKILGEHRATLATSGNQNNHLGVPLTLCSLEEEHQFCIVEMGANHRGEIRDLSKLASPDAAILTPIAPAHVEGFGSLENIYQAKLEILEGMPKDAPIVILDSDPRLVEELRKRNRSFYTVGDSESADFQVSGVRRIGAGFEFSIKELGNFTLESKAVFFVWNAAMALVMAKLLGCPPNQFSKNIGLGDFPSGRFHEKINTRGIRIIDDAYNANPLSFKASLEALKDCSLLGKKILVFGDMLELGEEAERYHCELGAEIAHHGFDFVFACGPLSKFSTEELRSHQPEVKVEHFQDSGDLSQALKKVVKKDDLVLFKASRGMQLEKIIQSLDR